MIDLHTHVLPGIDDGPAEISGSIAIAREALRAGVTILAGTPHVRDDYPTSVEGMRSAVAAVQKSLLEAGVDVEVLPGAEIAFDRLSSLGLDELEGFSLAGSNTYLLVELPRYGWPLDVVERIHELRGLGFTTVLAHPERSFAVQESPRLLADLVRNGVLVQITAGSLVGGFGRSANRTARKLLAADFVHLLATDTHKEADRGRALLPALATLGDQSLSRWLTSDVPAAIIEGLSCPPRPSTRSLRLPRRGR